LAVVIYADALSASINEKATYVLASFFLQVSSEPIYIVTEFMCNGSLLDYLRSGAGKKATFTDHVDMAAQVT